jgi:hypothetical protein
MRHRIAALLAAIIGTAAVLAPAPAQASFVNVRYTTHAANAGTLEVDCLHDGKGWINIGHAPKDTYNTCGWNMTGGVKAGWGVIMKCYINGQWVNFGYSSWWGSGGESNCRTGWPGSF